MIFWEELEEKVDCYKINASEDNMNNIIVYSVRYLKVCAMNSRKKANANGVFIPFDDFYSQYLLTLWETVLDYVDIENHSLKNVLLHRLFIAERKVWRLYKKKSYSPNDKDNISYTATRWNVLNDEILQGEIYSAKYEGQITLQECLQAYRKENQEDSKLIELLIKGYSPSESVKILGINLEYNAAARKKCNVYVNLLNAFSKHTVCKNSRK